MTSPRKLLVVLLCCAVVAWLAGPPSRLLVALPLLLFGPGYLLERALPPPPRPTLGLRPALWMGLSLSIVALLYQWITALGLALSATSLNTLAACCGIGITWRLWRHPTADHRPPTTDLQGGEGERGRGGDRPISNLQSQRHLVTLSPCHLATVALPAIFALTLWTRFAQIAELALPAWVDSVHHALLVRVAMERGQAPFSLRPYLPVDQLPYHWGYHVFQAAVTQLSGVPLERAMLWVGQVLNALHTLSVAALAAYIWRRPLAGVVAALVVGLLSIMPAYYVSWGRYTQLTGLLLLPPLAIAWLAGLRAPSRRWLLCTATLLAGLMLIHLRILIFALCFMAVSAAIDLMTRSGEEEERGREGEGERGRLYLFSPSPPLPRLGRLASLRPRLGYIVATVALALALAAPWNWTLATRALAGGAGSQQGLVGGGDYNRLSEALLWAGHNRLLAAAALCAALAALLRRSRPAAEQVGWVGALVLLANPWIAGYVLPATGVVLALSGASRRRAPVLLLGIALMLLNPALVRFPYLWLITNDVVTISLFIPIGVLIGGGVGMLVDWADHRPPTTTDHPLSSILYPLSSILRISPSPPLPLSVVRGVIGALLIAAAAWGAWDLRSVINPATVLATSADVAAIAWAAEHTPPDARFLINATSWLPDADRAVDGGWWLLPLAGRQVTTPPVLFTYGAPGDVRAARAVSRQVANFQPGQEQALYQLIERERITHIYLGPRPGPLSAATFADQPAFEKIYERDGVIILAVHL